MNGVMRTVPLWSTSAVGIPAPMAMAVSPWRGEYPMDPSNPTSNRVSFDARAVVRFPFTGGGGAPSPTARLVSSVRTLPPSMMSPAQSLSPSQAAPQLADMYASVAPIRIRPLGTSTPTPKALSDNPPLRDMWPSRPRRLTPDAPFRPDESETGARGG